ncbi:MAG TPA: ABC transporter substrate-binding protein [Candidatus Binatia bacterium]|nr:ABC transporter substrate-binding protein [Candidatus Binatia bacterium]
MKRSLLILAVLAFISGAAHAADQAAAQKEGRVVIYSSTDSASAEPLLQDFKSQYPGIVVEYNDLNTTEVYNRFLAEAAAGAGTADFLWSSAMDLQLQLVQSGNAQPYTSPETAHLPKWAVWQNQAFGTTFEPVTMTYNKRLLPQDAVPSSHADLVKLLKEKAAVFKGKLATFDPEKSGVGFLMMTQDLKVFPAFWDLAKAMGSVDVKVYTSTGAMLEKVSSGEHTLAYNIIGSYGLLRQQKDQSIGIVFPKDYLLAFSRIAFVPKGARHPNAGKLFLDYILSKRAQTIMANKALIYALRDDVEGQATAAALNKEMGKVVKPIEVGPDLLTALDKTKRLDFLKRWQEALKR